MISLKSLPSPDDPAEALAAVVALRVLADKLEHSAVNTALEQGWSWSQIRPAQLQNDVFIIIAPWHCQ